MKKVVLFVVLIICSTLLRAQNLVPNSSFEDTIHCPFDVGLLSYCVGWNSYRSSPDYFNPCSKSSDIGVPLNAFGRQYAYTGESYAGLGTSHIDDYREIIGRKLSSSLIIDTKYYVSMRVSLSDNSYYASNNIGITFSTIPFDKMNIPPINNQAKVYTTSVIRDTTDWILLCGSFIADSAYKYIMIGNFFTNSLTDTVTNNQINPFQRGISYYYIDDVCVSTDSSTCNSGLGIKSESSVIFNIYPNPSNDLVYIETNSDAKFSYSLFALLGNLLQSSVADKKMIIDVSTIPADIYFLQIQFNNSIIQKKLIIAH